MIGAYNCTFNKKTLFIYKCNTDVRGYTIRKQNWVAIMSENEGLSTKVKANIEKEYLSKIKVRMLVEKNKAIKKLKETQNEILGVIQNNVDLDENAVEKKVEDEEDNFAEEFKRVEETVSNMTYTVYLMNRHLKNMSGKNDGLETELNKAK